MSATVIAVGVPAPDDAIVILPSPFVMVILLPAVSVAAAGPEEPPIISCPLVVSATEPTVSVPVSCDINTALSVNDVAPVPPLATARVADRPVALPVKAPTKSVEVMLVAPVITPASTLIVPSSNIAEPAAGSIFIAAPESSVNTPAESMSTVPSAVIWIFAAAAALSTVTREKAPFVAAVIVTVSLAVGVNVITSSVITVVPMVKSVVASIVAPEIAPVVVIAPEPTLIEVNPDVIEPEFKAPTVTRLAAAVIEACVPPVTVAAVPDVLPVTFPVTFPVKLPVTDVVVIIPVEGL